MRQKAEAPVKRIRDEGSGTLATHSTAYSVFEDVSK
jgi:hypothetical protein